MTHRERKPRRYGIYLILNLLNGWCYVGSSVDILNTRWQRFWRLQSGKHKNSLLQQDYLLMGKKAFEFRILEMLEADAAAAESLARETYWYNRLKAEGRDLYNLRPPRQGDQSRSAGQPLSQVPRAVRRRIQRAAKREAARLQS